MKIDLTLKITPKVVADAQGNAKIVAMGHMGTHFDVMDKEFPLEYTQREIKVFDVAHIRDRDIEASDIPMEQVRPGMFVAFYTGFIEEEPYGTGRYFMEHPQLSPALIDALLEKKISIIGLDCSGVRRGKEHVPMDQRCADRGVFVVENLCNLKQVMAQEAMTVHTYPMNFAGMTGLPCRVIATKGE